MFVYFSLNIVALESKSLHYGSGCLCLVFKTHSEITMFFHGPNATYFVASKR